MTGAKKSFVLTAAFISIMLLFVARHHPPSRRKIKEIWHGRMHWEGESNTTMLRSSPEKALGSIEPTKVSDPKVSDAQPVENTTPNVSDAQPVENTTPNVIAPLNTKPMIAICAATHSKSNWRSLGDTTLRNLLIPSIQRTISSSDRSKYDFRLYLAADHDDHFWLNNQNNIKTPDWLSVHIGFYDVPEHKIPFNPMMRSAYNDGAEYLVRINDDSEFVTSDWVSKTTAKLATYDPPNVGMVGPNCREGNTAIMTHDMVHRTHLDIFEHYYPDVFSAWWIDDWISKVYGPQRSTKMMDWTVKHHTHKHGTRYAVQHHEAQLLQGELEKGAAKIEAWLLSSTEPVDLQHKQNAVVQPTDAKPDILNLDDPNPTSVFTNARWTLLLTVNNDYMDLFINFMHWFQKLKLDIAVTVIAEDVTALKSLRKLKLPENVVVRASDLIVQSAPSGAWNTPNYNKLVSKRPHYIVNMLKSGTRVLYADIDSVWLSSPLSYWDEQADIMYGIDHKNNDHKNNDNKNNDNGINYCSGFMFIKPNKRTINFFEEWQSRQANGTERNQHIFNELLRVHTEMRQKVLPENAFPAGHMYFNSKRTKGAVVVHNNYIIGHDAKVARFKAHHFWLSDQPIDEHQTQNQVISYSLYGSNPRYIDGALENAKLAKEIYPGWIMRVYYDNTVPQRIIEKLRSEDVQLVDMTNSKMNKMSWRFQAASDAKRFCARDIDSRLSKREAAAVEDWVQSGKQFHVMRDHPSHSNYPMSGGMWCSTTIPNIQKLLIDVKNHAYLQDMNFLNKVIWPMAQKSLLQHDSFSCDKFGGGKPFPIPRIGWEHVGSVYINGIMRQGDVVILKTAGIVKKCTFTLPSLTSQTGDGDKTSVSLSLMMTSKDLYPDVFLEHFLQMLPKLAKVNILIDEDPTSSDVAIMLERINVVTASWDVRIAFKNNFDLERLVKKHLGSTASVAAAGYAPKRTMFTSYLSAIDMCDTHFCIHLDTDVFMHRGLAWVQLAVETMKKDATILSLGPPWSYKDETSRYPHTKTAYGKRWDTGHGFTARAFVLNRQLYESMLPLEAPHDTHWENMISRTTAARGITVGEVSQWYSPAWAITLLGRAVRETMNRDTVVALWDRVENNCVPPSQEKVYALTAEDVRQWSSPCVQWPEKETRDRQVHVSDVCLSGKPYGRSTNQILSIIHAIPQKGTLALDKRWSDFYLKWFEKEPIVKLYFEGTCYQTMSPETAYGSARQPNRFNQINFHVLTLNSKLVARAKSELLKYEGKVATVHGRWLEGTCESRAMEFGNFCTEHTQTWKETCHYTLDAISQLIPKNIQNIVYMSDGQKTNYAKTFEKIDHNSFEIQVAMMIYSDYHFGNPMSSIDYFVSKMRHNKQIYPEECYTAHPPSQETISQQTKPPVGMPVVVVKAIAMPHERDKDWFKKHLNIAKDFGYDISVFNAEDAFQHDPALNLNLQNGPGTNGCFRSHVKNWATLASPTRSVITVEADAMALRSMNANVVSLLHEYDIVALHNYKDAPKTCIGDVIKSGAEFRSYSYGTGALFFNGKSLSRAMERWSQGPLSVGIDHWLNNEAKSGILKIGVLCSGLFKLVSHAELGITSRRVDLDKMSTTPRLNVPSVFWTGFPLDGFSHWLFPSSTIKKYEPSLSKMSDAILIVGLGGGTEWKQFTGTVIAINGESKLISGYNDLDGSKSKRLLLLGPGETSVTRLFFPNALVEYLNFRENGKWTRDHSDSRRWVVAYSNSHCTPRREKIADTIAGAGIPVVAIGKCRGTHPNIKHEPIPLDFKKGITWKNNALVLNKFGIVLALENTITEGYLSEKLLMAFAAGAVPVYSGAGGADTFFNPNSFIRWKDETKDATVTLIRNILQSRAAWERMRSQPMLATDETNLLSVWRERILQTSGTGSTDNNTPEDHGSNPRDPPLSAKAFRDAADVVWSFPYAAYGEVVPKRVIPSVTSRPLILYTQTSPDVGTQLSKWTDMDFVLVSGASDYKASVMAKVLSNPRLIHWFGENADIDDARVTAIPIGINAWQHSSSLRGLVVGRNNIRIQLLLMNFGTTSNPSRIGVWDHFCGTGTMSWITCSSKKGHPSRDGNNDNILVPYYSEVKAHKYQLCPPGNGMDTHRIYEALALGTIPILLLGQSDQMDNLYSTLPVLGVSSWEHVTEVLLNREYDRLRNGVAKWSLEGEFKKWLNKIKLVSGPSSNEPVPPALDFVPTAKRPYPATKLTWGTCTAPTYPQTLRDAANIKWRVVLSTDSNPNYLAFLPSAVAHWKKLGLEVTVGLVVLAEDTDTDKVVSAIKSAVNVDLRILTVDASLPVGHAAKLARGFLATQFGSDVVTIVDIDYYLLWFEEWSAHLDCTPIDGLLTRGYNMYRGRIEEGKYPMYLGTAQSKTFAKFLNPKGFTNYNDWLQQFRKIHVFDGMESPFGVYGTFSDESLFRALLSRGSPPVILLDKPKSWRRIDRAQNHRVTTQEISQSSDVFPNRPLANCGTYFSRTLPVQKYLGILSPSRDADFIETLRALKLKNRDWAQKQYKKVQSLYKCNEAKSNGLNKNNIEPK
tara:strand:- start:27833 stop:35488 length:7656 start_codon:yes stop_codon:yes gene_type:complete